MISVSKEWNPKQKYLKELLHQNNDILKIRAQLLDMHSYLHESIISDSTRLSYMDKLINNLDNGHFRFCDTKKKTSIAWNIWHITLIEDAVVNILMKNNTLVLNKSWVQAINTPFQDTGNAFSLLELSEFSECVNQDELFAYRRAVGKQSRAFFSKLELIDLNHGFSDDQKERLFVEGILLNKRGSKELASFWAKKNIAGLLTMPITRHQIVHINDSFRLKQKQL